MRFHTEIDMSKGKLCYRALEEPNMVIFFVLLLQMSVSSYSKTMQSLVQQAEIVAQMAFKVSKNLLNLLHDPLEVQLQNWRKI